MASTAGSSLDVLTWFGGAMMPAPTANRSAAPSGAECKLAGIPSPLATFEGLSTTPLASSLLWIFLFLFVWTEEDAVLLICS
mmetsp:Transcript_47636/g.112762  ORF Transcript_47636/g.112762 Transcript_47636/m.112762 type:complete len:82 (+) Transcript_47636:798-1043(+)|eukprot:815188-Rhodomonas_salina.3